MSRENITIIIVETSPIIYEGIVAVLTKTGHPYNIHLTDNLVELQQMNLRIKADIVLINPVLIQNQIKDFHALKKEFENTLWIGAVFTFFDQQILSSFDGIIYLNDSPEKINALVRNLIYSHHQPNNKTRQPETLSEREIDVLKLMVEGNANKEIADKLNISPHTVISHRKNISHKTGIKSVAGLTIYAVVNHIIALDTYRE